MTTVHVVFMRFSAAVAQVDCGIQTREVFLRRTLGETAEEVRRKCRNATALDEAMNWAWKQVIKPQAQKHAEITDRNLGMLAEEKISRERVENKNDAFHACLRAVERESAALIIFDQKRAAVATVLRNSCVNEMKDV